MRRIWHRLERTDAINWIVISVVCILQFVGSFVISNAQVGGRILLFVGCITISVLVLMLIMLITRYGITPFIPAHVRPIVVLLMLQVAAFSRALVYDYLLVSLNFSAEGMLLGRIYASQINIFVAGIIVSSLVSMAREFSEKNEELARTLEELQKAQEDIEARLENRRIALVTSIKSQLESALSSVTGTNVRSDAQHLKSLIDNVVRPISHRLGRDFSSPAETAAPPIVTRIRWSSVTAYALSTNPIHPVWMTVWTAFVSVQVISTAAGKDFLFPYLSAVGLFALWFTLTRFVWGKTSSKLGIFPRALTFSGMMLLTPLVVNSILEFEFGLSFFNFRVVLSAAFYFLVMSWSLALIIAVAKLLKQTNSELVEATIRLRRQLITDNVSARHFEQSVSHVLHGPIQDAIAASLKRVQSLPPDALPGEVEGDIIRHHIDHALELLDGSPLRNYSVERGIKDLADLWSGLVEIEVLCEKSTFDVLDTAQTTSSIVIEVVREAVSNAIRHGDATEIVVDIGFIASESDIHITVTNNGSELPSEPAEGIGTKMLDEMTLKWSRENSTAGVMLMAVVPVHTG